MCHLQRPEGAERPSLGQCQDESLSRGAGQGVRLWQVSMRQLQSVSYFMIRVPCFGFRRET
jgi:hypothetical protein